MSILLLLIPISLLFVAAGAVAFFWAVNHDQFDDMDTPGLLPLADSDLVDGAGRAGHLATAGMPGAAEVAGRFAESAPAIRSRS